MYKVADLFREHKDRLDLEIISGHDGLNRKIAVPEAQRPGLSLSGYLKGYAQHRLLIFGRIEIVYLRDHDEKERASKLSALLSSKTPACIVARRHLPPKELVALSNERSIPLFRSKMPTMNLLSRLTLLLAEAFSPTVCCHGTLVEVFGVGVLIQGESAVGKSEAALGLIERGHRLISDDLVKVRRKEGGYLEGSGMELTRHHIEVRGIGIINVAHIYGAVCILEKKSVDLVVQLEAWNDDHFYDRLGLDEKMKEILEVKVPFHLLPVKPGRDVVLLLETIALNHRLKNMGYHSAKEFRGKLLDLLEKKGKKRENFTPKTKSPNFEGAR